MSSSPRMKLIAFDDLQAYSKATSASSGFWRVKRQFSSVIVLNNYIFTEQQSHIIPCDRKKSDHKISADFCRTTISADFYRSFTICFRNK